MCCQSKHWTLDSCREPQFPVTSTSAYYGVRAVWVEREAESPAVLKSSSLLPSLPLFSDYFSLFPFEWIYTTRFSDYKKKKKSTCSYWIYTWIARKYGYKRHKTNLIPGRKAPSTEVKEESSEIVLIILFSERDCSRELKEGFSKQLLPILRAIRQGQCRASGCLVTGTCD